MAGVDYLITARGISGAAFNENVGTIRYLRVPTNVAIPTPAMATSSKTDLAKWVKEVRDIADGDPNQNSISVAGDILVFIHGYNNDLDIIMKRQRQLAKDLKAEGWKGLVIGFDWPSDNETLAYWQDRSKGAEVAVKLVSDCITVLAQGQEKDCVTNVHLLGHSTGAYVAMEAFVQAEKDGALFKSNWRVSQVAFIAGDVASSSLSANDSWSGPMFKRILRLTNYSNPYDSVLAASNAKRLGVAPRAGRVGLPADAHAKATNVNCGDYFATLDPNKSTFFGDFTHSWHIGNRVFARDLAMTLEGAIDRDAIPTRAVVGGALILQDKPRPKFMADWGIKAATTRGGAPRDGTGVLS
ncbi:alpha/beta fold hydrolase [Tardiphaga sp. 813_E8_N1_3]|uniref:alpha/beta fold hydrolase n=1 Tax=Tardiphaga sp. 813_E8_N1_3 TaxID=3240760 RepID=UPI003F213440